VIPGYLCKKWENEKDHRQEISGEDQKRTLKNLGPPAVVSEQRPINTAGLGFKDNFPHQYAQSREFYPEHNLYTRTKHKERKKGI